MSRSYAKSRLSTGTTRAQQTILAIANPHVVLLCQVSTE